MFPNKLLLWTQRLFVTSMFYRWRLEPVLVLKMETIFYIPSCYSKLITTSPRAAHPRFTGYLIRVYGPKPCPCAVNWIPLPYKSSEAFQKIDDRGIKKFCHFRSLNCISLVGIEPTLRISAPTLPLHHYYFTNCPQWWQIGSFCHTSPPELSRRWMHLYALHSYTP